jgi:hypothetical protein|tara:strand:+ start:1385 stop:1762 length:378 start_codon:yes stop_codon:yes gene_type:complete
MKLKELQKMIKEEMASFVSEEETIDVAADMDALDAPEIDVDVDAGDIDLDGAELEGGSEDVLRGIYDQLAAYFETEADVADEDEFGAEEELPMDDMGGEEEAEEEIEEGSQALQERFKKLANIIK